MRLKVILLLAVLLTYCFGIVSCAYGCPASALATLSFIVEYALWRGWHQALIYTSGLEDEFRIRCLITNFYGTTQVTTEPYFARGLTPTWPFLIVHVDRFMVALHGSANYGIHLIGCNWAVVRLVKCLGVNGVASAVDRPKARLRGKLGLAILVPSLRQNYTHTVAEFLKKLADHEMNTAAFDWLMASRSHQDFKYINEILNSTALRFDQNIVVGYPFAKNRPNLRSLGLCDANFIYKVQQKEEDWRYNGRNTHKRRNDVYSYNSKREDGIKNKTFVRTDYERNYYRTTERFRNLFKNKVYKKSGKVIPLYLGGILNYNNSRAFAMTNISKLSLRSEYSKWRKNNFENVDQGIHVVQYFKVRVNSTLYASVLGNWDREQSMSQVEVPYPVEARNFLGEELTVGRCNSSGDGATSLDDDGPSAPASLDDVLHFFAFKLNTTRTVTRYYNKLGFRTYEGAWTGLLGALMDYTVDLALEPVTAHPPRHHDMDFIFPIAETMCNIYIRHQETSTVRDIFLAPFSARLVVCVVAVAVGAALVVVLISRVAVTQRHQSRPVGYTEALIWSTAILCQQGGTWTPPNPAASVLLIVCLLFALVTYNSYAAFITSVLSVRVASLDTVAAVLHSPNFKIGYIKNGADQMYLMSTKDAQLNAFYIRGYSDAENLVSSAEEGLARAASQDYAFFAGQRAARSTLRSLSQARGRCAVRELPVYSTRADLAFPLPKRSPYARPILVSLLELRSSGALARLEAALVPAMPQCAPPRGFASARAADVRSALFLLLAGLIAAALLGIGEYCWKNRKELVKYFRGLNRRLMGIVNW